MVNKYKQIKSFVQHQLQLLPIDKKLTNQAIHFCVCLLSTQTLEWHVSRHFRLGLTVHLPHNDKTDIQNATI